MTYLYIIQSNKSKHYYIGVSDNPTKRLLQHNLGYVRSTRNKGPWILRYTQEFQRKIDALRIEYKIKKLKRRDYIERIIYDGIIKITE